MPPSELRSRFDFLVSDIARLIGRRFDRIARERLGLSLAQVRLLRVLASDGGDGGLTQQALAERLDLSQMGVATLCSRMEAAGWIRRIACPSDRRAKLVSLRPAARKALVEAVGIADGLQREALSALGARERSDLVQSLARVHQTLTS